VDGIRQQGLLETRNREEILTLKPAIKDVDLQSAVAREAKPAEL
jgi:hypothetical protein